MTGCRRGRQRRRGVALLRVAALALPLFFDRLVVLLRGPPQLQTLGKVGDHAALDFGQDVAHQAITAWALAVAAVADSANPQKRRFPPTWRTPRPPGISQQPPACRGQRRPPLN